MDSAADNDDHCDDEMLADVLVKARHLVANLEREQADLQANPPKIDARDLAEGQMAMNNALAAARRMLKALEDAVVVRVNENDKDNHPDDN